MKRIFIYAMLVLGLGAVGYYGNAGFNAAHRPPKASLVVGEDPDQRLKTLYAQQDAVYLGRYGGLDALKDIDRGAPKLLWSGLPHAYDGQWVAILQERFAVRAEFISGCESSATLVNYADAYNAAVEKYIVKKFGPDALAKSQEDAMRIPQQGHPTDANRPPEPPRPTGG